jgi:hypothetical protein
MACEKRERERERERENVCVAYQLNYCFFIGLYTFALIGKRKIQKFNYLTIYFHGARLTLWLLMSSGTTR